MALYRLCPPLHEDADDAHMQLYICQTLQVMYTVVEDAPVYRQNMRSHQRIFDAMLAQVIFCGMCSLLAHHAGQ